ncbi:hypothetical protein V7S43_013012 [Phytophthora oleae]|uniref:HTH CENPB-type domain-containing protein n=1 Tax=Phytophthora oleae TaxID=2107226 RepID=A0ABD3F4F8_9STRA
MKTVEREPICPQDVAERGRKPGGGGGGAKPKKRKFEDEVMRDLRQVQDGGTQITSKLILSGAKEFPEFLREVPTQYRRRSWALRFKNKHFENRESDVTITNNVDPSVVAELQEKVNQLQTAAKKAEELERQLNVTKERLEMFLESGRVDNLIVKAAVGKLGALESDPRREMLEKIEARLPTVLHEEKDREFIRDTVPMLYEFREMKKKLTRCEGDEVFNQVDTKRFFDVSSRTRYVCTMILQE